MKMMDIESDSEPINIELIKKMKVEEYIEYQINRQIELLNKYTEKKIQDLTDHKNTLKKEIIEKNNQQIDEILNNSNGVLSNNQDDDEYDDEEYENKSDDNQVELGQDDEEFEEEEEEFEEEEFETQ
ncbi:hypothetical protein DICPUDRAFT_91342 [Dictyostelium purpureum]|uniref:Uncharacterized protein n=1 Tax=Dictyostelium purpureum TaxID=5786 RepID=F0ZAW4_DICPU|nr:uncharacterized protein DICPUDRAFT_91342 [Dictyostelium purpureum]EGC38872.1 hypothetical protein DICPUDRAFT_91342 [Dictyostelium purpureum]|eukprot:XP_003284552.1 hypothetical protein DICPUDRAFT_91342 [Dictyostelium purpureum]